MRPAVLGLLATPKIYDAWNPSDKESNVTLSNENRTANRNAGGSTWEGVRSKFGRSSGRYYSEFTIDVIQNDGYQIGVLDGSSSLQAWPGEYATGWVFEANDSVNSDTRKGNNNSSADYGDGVQIVATDVIMMAWDLINSKIWWGKNGVWYASGDPAAGTNAAFTNLSGTVYPVFSGFLNFNSTITANFGDAAWAYSAPSGFLSPVQP